MLHSRVMLTEFVKEYAKIVVRFKVLRVLGKDL